MYSLLKSSLFKGDMLVFRGVSIKTKSISDFLGESHLRFPCHHCHHEGHLTFPAHYWWKGSVCLAWWISNNTTRSWMNMEGKKQILYLCAWILVLFCCCFLVSCTVPTMLMIYSFPSSCSADGRENGALPNRLWYLSEGAGLQPACDVDVVEERGSHLGACWK